MTTILICFTLLWLLWASLVEWVRRAAVRPDDLRSGVVVRTMHLIARVVHRLRVTGREHIPPAPGRGAPPIVVVANHTAFIDPLLIQSALPFEVRWIMAADMASPRFSRFWDFARVILVDRRVNESAPLREAIKHLKAGGVIGVFPEGFIERPPRTLFPFKEGVGLLVSRSGARVLPVIIEGTPQLDDGSRALFTPSRSTLRVLPAIDYSARILGPAEIAADLRRVFLNATGWPTSDRIPRWEHDHWVDIALDGTELIRAPQPGPH